MVSIVSQGSILQKIRELVEQSDWIDSAALVELKEATGARRLVLVVPTKAFNFNCSIDDYTRFIDLFADSAMELTPNTELSLHEFRGSAALDQPELIEILSDLYKVDSKESHLIWHFVRSVVLF